MSISFALSFEGNDADDHEIDFYDVAHALIGFQRSLAITTHLVLNGEVITQAPSLKGARIIAVPPEEGSWKILAAISMFGIGAYHVSTAPKDTLLGHLVYSAYDYVVSENLGFHVDYDKSLGQLYEEHHGQSDDELPVIKQSQLDSAAEKCENAIREMHRPIVFSETAQQASIIANLNGKQKPFDNPLDYDSFEYINFTERSTDAEEIEGYVSSYNSNTYKGRLFVPDMRRPIPFMLGETAQNMKAIGRITRSLHMNGQERMKHGSEVRCVAFKNHSRTGRLKSLYVVEVKE